MQKKQDRTGAPVTDAVATAREPHAADTVNEQLALALQLGGLGHWELDLDSCAFTTSTLCRANFGRSAEQAFTYDDLRASIHPEDRERQARVVADAIENRAEFEVEYRVATPVGELRYINVRGRFEDTGGHGRLVGVSRDVTAARQRERWLQEQTRLLELVASDTALDDVLRALGDAVERVLGGARAAVLIANAERSAMARMVSGSIPESFGLRIAGAPISGLMVGTCGTAIFENHAISCGDVRNDARWSREWRELCEAHGVLACHSTPIHGENGVACASLMLCFGTPHEPDAWEQSIGALAANVAGIAIQHQSVTRALRDAGVRQAFLLQLSDALRKLADPTAVAETACRLLVEKLGVSRGQYASVSGDPCSETETGEIRGQHVVAGQPMPLRFPLAPFGEVMLALLRAGQTAVIDDTDTDARLGDAMRAAYAAIDARALVVVPLVKNGRLVAAFGLHQQSPRTWTPTEIALVEEVAERTWSAIERACAEQAVAESEQRQQLALDAAAIGAFVWYPEEGRDEPDARTLELFEQSADAGLPLDTVLAKVHPGDRGSVSAAIAHALDPSGKGKLDEEMRLVRADGTLRWVSLRGQSEFAGEPARAVRMSGTVRDISERKRRELDLAFLAEVSEDLVRRVTLEPMIAALCKKITTYFNAAGCAFAETDMAQQVVAVKYQWSREGLPSLDGEYRLADYHSDAFRQASMDGEIFVVSDTASDPRVDAAGMAARSIRALISIPLLRGGEWCYQLTVCSDAPRDWSYAEVSLVRELASRIWLRIERSRAETALGESEVRYRHLFNSIDEGFCIIEVLYDHAGAAVDLRYIEVNPAFERHNGLVGAPGKTLTEMGIALEANWYATYDKVVRTGKPVRVEQYSEPFQRWFDVNAFRVGDPAQHRLAVLFTDTTRRKQENAALVRLASIVASSDDAIISKDLRGVIVTWNKAAEAMFGYTAEEAIGRPIVELIIPPDRIAEEEEILRRIGRGEVIDHFETVRRCKDGLPVHVSVTISPLKENGRVVGASKIARDISERKRAEEHRELLINELNHRVKNTLATVQALAMQTFRGSDESHALEAFEARLFALSAAHDVLTRESWKGARIHEIVRNALEAWSGGNEPRYHADGPSLRLRPSAALAVAMALHELATNASKYGALTNGQGTVEVRWTITDAAEPVFRLAWREHGGPPVRAPARRGFGSRLIEQGLAHDLGGNVQLTFDAGGVACIIEAPLDEIREEARAGTEPRGTIA